MPSETDQPAQYQCHAQSQPLPHALWQRDLKDQSVGDHEDLKALRNQAKEDLLKHKQLHADEEYADDHVYEEATDEALDTASLLFSQPGDEELALLKQMKE